MVMTVTKAGITILASISSRGLAKGREMMAGVKGAEQSRGKTNPKRSSRRRNWLS
jgi:hypothetical protein